MKYETLMRQNLFSACRLVCVLVMGAMLTTRPHVPDVASSQTSLQVVVDSAD